MANAKTNELQSHLFALQSQMNPHFIHNILTIISMEAQEFDQIKIMNICSRLSRMLHYSSSMGDGFSTVAEELKHTSNYIPKLIIQPVCENSFNHAFKVIEPDWKLNIKAYSKDKQWFVEIKDNGKGFNEEFLNKVELMRKNVSMENAKAALEKLEIGGLSILNIYMRLRLIYGEGMVFILRNDADGATVVLGGEIENVKSIDRRG